VVTPSGGKLWRFDYRHDEKRKTLAMGKWPEIELAAARARRDNARKRIADGGDPAAADKAQALAIENAFETIARNWHAGARSGWSPRYARMILDRLEADIFPHVGKDHIDSIEPPRLLEVIRKVESRGAIEMAKRIKNYCSEIFMYGIAEGKCRRDPAADIRRALRKPRPKKHRAAVSPSEFPALVVQMHAYDGDALTKLALLFTLITMVRTQETRFARVEEFENLDGQEPLWRLSPERMKMSREHLVPLPRQAVTIIKRLREMSPESRFLFPANTRTGVISENTMLYGLYRLGYHSRQTTHGLRRCASTILNESGKFEADWIEAQLAHSDADKVRGAYNAAIYLPHRRQMLQWWADFVEKPTNVYRIAA
jgi:integrase